MDNTNLAAPYRGAQPYLFASYAHKDIGTVMPIIERMQRDGFRIWYDEGIDPGTEWADNIADHIDGCAFFVSFLSEDYLVSTNCRDELDYARSREKQRLLVYLAPLTLPKGMEMRTARLRNIHKYRYASEDAFFEQLYLAQGILECRGPRPDAGKGKHFALTDRKAPEKRFTLADGTYIIGRDPRKAQIVLDDQYVSQVHAILTVADGKCRIRDLNSTGGVLVDGRRIDGGAEYELRAGGSLRLGDTEFILDAEETCPESTQRAPDKRQNGETACDWRQGLKPGMVIEGKYRVLELMERGRFQSIWLTENETTGKQWVIRESTCEGENYAYYRKNLQREIGILNRLEHPSIPTIVDVLESDGRILTITDRIRGDSVAALRRSRGALDRKTVIHVAKQLCGVLEYLHSQTPMIIHNDIHPRSVILMPDGRVMLIGFSEACEYSPAGIDEFEKTVMGTRSFAAPETVRGVADVRTDIYSLGVTLYYAMGRRSGFPGQPKDGTDGAAVPDYGAGLERIVTKCLEPDPEKRYQSAQEMLRDLNALDREPERPASEENPKKKRGFLGFFTK